MLCHIAAGHIAQRLAGNVEHPFGIALALGKMPDALSLLTAPDECCPGTISKQDARAAIAPVDDLRQVFRTDHQRACALLQHGTGTLQRIEESAARRIEVKCHDGLIHHPQALLYQTGRAGHRLIAAERRYDQ